MAKFHSLKILRREDGETVMQSIDEHGEVIVLAKIPQAFPADIAATEFVVADLAVYVLRLEKRIAELERQLNGE